MKIRLSLFVIFLLFINDAFAQKVRFSDVNNEWNVRLTNVGGVTDGWIYPYNYTASVQKNGYAYNVLEGTVNTHDSILVREDTLLQKVYCIAYKVKGFYTNDTVEKVLYDFSLQVGDTFSLSIPTPWSPQTPYTNTHLVLSVDSFFINGTVHKKWSYQTLQGGMPYDVVEGLGAMNDPAFPLFPIMYPVSGVWWDLVCFSNQNTYPYIVPYPNAQAPINNILCSLSYCPSPVVTVTHLDDTSVLFTWPSDSVNEFMYSYSQGSLFTNVTHSADTFLLVTGLTPGTTYYFSLRSACSDWGYKTIATTVTGVAEVSAEVFSIAPNPVGNMLTIYTLPGYPKGYITIYEGTGRKVISATLYDKITYVDVSRLRTGLYFLKYSSGGQVRTVKFIKTE